MRSLVAPPRAVRAPAGRTETLATAFDPRDNALGDLRLGLSVLVLVVHAQVIGFGHDPSLGSTSLGSLAVDAFFVLSGFLVARSYLRLGGLRAYAWNRLLRIMPAFWACIAITALVLAPVHAVIAGRPALSVFSGPDDALGYLTDNLTLHIGQFGIAGLPMGGSAPGVMNGSLWTLAYEAGCYLVIGTLGVVGVLRRRPGLVAALATSAWLTVVAQQAGLAPDPSFVTHAAPRLLLLFLLGALGLLYSHRIPVRGDLAVLASVVLAGSLLAFDDYRGTGSFALAYLCLWAMVRLPSRTRRSDLSYGVYIWHWPVAQLLVAAGLAGAGAVTFLGGVLLLTVALAWVSWTLVEAPALALKSGAAVAPRERARTAR